MRAKFAIFTGLEILVLTVVVVSLAVPDVAAVVVGDDHAASPASPARLAIFGYFGVLGLFGIGTAAAVATGMRAGAHQTMTLVFVVLSIFGVGFSAVSLLFLAIGLFNLGPISLDLWPRWWRRSARTAGESSDR